MFNKTIFAIVHYFTSRASLKKNSRQKLAINTVIDLNPQEMKNQGIDILILDFDGVLASYGEASIPAVVANWLYYCSEFYPQGRLFLLSNNLFSERRVYLEKQFPDLVLVSSATPKPSPEGLLNIIQATQLKPECHALVDDRLLTGGMAASLAGIKFIYVKNPMRNLVKRPIKEGFFWFLRRLERTLIG